jgi:hypothetical protein
MTRRTSQYRRARFTGAGRPLSRSALRTMLEQELVRLSVELPRTVHPQIRHDDVRFAQYTLARGGARSNPLALAHKVVAGVAWERVVIARIAHLASLHEDLNIVAERWRPSGAHIDLDLVVDDHRKQVLWILDAKNSRPSDSQVEKMHAQIRLLRCAPDLTRGCPTILGVLVHRPRHLHPTPQGTADLHILRSTLQGVGDLLLAGHLPHEQRVRRRL